MTDCIPGLGRIARAAALALLAALPAGAQTGIPPGSVAVPFLTLRDATGQPAPARALGGARAALSAGYCILDENPGLLGPLAEATALKMPGRDYRLSALHLHSPATIFDALETSAGENRPALYIHGYYEGVERNCIRAGMVQRNLDLEGRLLLFSWPSDEEILSYASDESDLYWSVPAIAGSIAELVRRFGTGEVDVLGHSLGGRGAVLALDSLARDHAGLEALVDNVVLIAPDMDFDIFVQYLPRIRGVARTITVYISDKDLPLAVSAELHGYPRLGQTGNDVSGLDGVEVIDVSSLSGITDIDIPGAPASALSGHVYHLSNRTVAADIAILLKDGKRAADRPGMESLGPNLWRLTAGRN